MKSRILVLCQQANKKPSITRSWGVLTAKASLRAKTSSLPLHHTFLCLHAYIWIYISLHLIEIPPNSYFHAQVITVSDDRDCIMMIILSSHVNLCSSHAIIQVPPLPTLRYLPITPNVRTLLCFYLSNVLEFKVVLLILRSVDEFRVVILAWLIRALLKTGIRNLKSETWIYS